VDRIRCQMFRLTSMTMDRCVKVLGTIALVVFLEAMSGCGGSGSNAPSTPLSGNWQLNLEQVVPPPKTPLSVSGFLMQTKKDVTGSVVFPPVGPQTQCGGVASVTGKVNGQGVILYVNAGTTTLTFDGALSSDNSSITGNYHGPASDCYITVTAGTWTGSLIPPLTGTFTGTINSQYMQILQGASNPVPVTVSGSITQRANQGASNATLTGTINAVGYPCFSTASLTGTISGQSVYLTLFGYNGDQIGTLGQPSGEAGIPGSPATVTITNNQISLVDSNPVGLFLGAVNGTSTVGPCPAIFNGSGAQTYDAASVTLNFD